MEYNVKKSMEWSRLSSRKVLGSVFCELAKDNDFIVLCADVMSSADMVDFAREYPNRFFNVGIAENNMVAMATGIAETGKNVFVLTFAPFASMRCFEVVRTYVGYMNANVKIIGMASGLSMGVGGNTHFGLEDVSIIKTIPNMTVVSPADCTETVKSIESAMSYNGPMYIRLTGVNGNPIVYKNDYDFIIGKPNILKEGENIAVLSSGMCVYESMRACKILSREEINPTLVDMHTIKPIDEDFLKDICKNHKFIVTVEEEIGGLGSVISEYLHNNNLDNKLKVISLPNKFIQNGNYSYLMEYYGLTSKGIAQTISNYIGEIK